MFKGHLSKGFRKRPRIRRIDCLFRHSAHSASTLKPKTSRVTNKVQFSFK